MNLRPIRYVRFAFAAASVYTHTCSPCGVSSFQPQTLLKQTSSTTDARLRAPCSRQASQNFYDRPKHTGRSFNPPANAGGTDIHVSRTRTKSPAISAQEPRVPLTSRRKRKTGREHIRQVSGVLMPAPIDWRALPVAGFLLETQCG